MPLNKEAIMRETKRENTQLFFGALLTLIMCAFMTPNSYAGFKPIVCKTNFGEKSFTLEKHEIAFHKEDKGRSISSVLGSVTKKTHTGFNKVVYKNGQKHLIHIENEKKFDSNQDYMAITNNIGHKMTYPLNCSRAQ